MIKILLASLDAELLQKLFHFCRHWVTVWCLL